MTKPLLRVQGTGRFADASWDDALGELERLARAAGDSVVLALSGSETVEVASALSQLVRKGFGSHRVVLPEETSAALDAYRAPLSAIADAEIVVVIGDDPVAERAPVVDLWIRAARRNGAEVMTFGPAGTVQRPPGDGAAVVRELADRRKTLGKRLRDSRARRPDLVGARRARRCCARAARAGAGPRRTNRAAARTTSPPRPTAAASRRRGRQQARARPEHPSESACCSSRVRKRWPIRGSASSPSAARQSSR